MAVTHTIFDELIIGSPLHIDRTIKLATNVGTLEKCWLTVKDNRTKTDPEAIIKKSITVTPSSAGQITDQGGSGIGRFIFHLLPIDTQKFEHGKVYIIDIWVKTTLDSPAGIETGTIKPHYAVTLDPS